jgi:hypothetical protein
MGNIIEGLIDPNQCIGDSLERINNNFDYLDKQFRVGYTCERNGLGGVGQFLAHGNGASAHQGIGMPYDGELIKAVLTVTGLDGELIVAPAINNVVYNDYRLRIATSVATSDVEVSEYNPLLPLTFEAGDTFGWRQMTLPVDALTSCNVNFIVRFDI